MYVDTVSTNFCVLNLSEYGVECESFTIIFIDSLLVYGNKYYVQVYLDNCAYKILNTEIVDCLWCFIIMVIHKMHISIKNRISILIQMNPRVWGEHLTNQLSWIAVWLLVAHVCLVYLVDVLVLVFFTPLWLG